MRQSQVDDEKAEITDDEEWQMPEPEDQEPADDRFNQLMGVISEQDSELEKTNKNPNSY